MKLKKVNEFGRYMEIVDSYKRKSFLTNDYLYNEAADLIIHDRLYECCGADNAFLFVKKDECLRVYYYLNDLAEMHNFDVEENIVTEILFRGNLGIPDMEIEYLQKCGFKLFLRRDQYVGVYKDLIIPVVKQSVSVQKAKTLNDVEEACELFNSSFDHYSGDYISEMMEQKLFADGNIWIARDANDNFAGALHQTIDRGVAWVSHVAVLPAYRNQGVGNALLDAFVEHNHVDEKSRYMLWVQAQNEPAVRMYQKKGFKYTNKSTISMIKLK